MAHQNTTKAEKVLDMGGGYAIWRVHIDALRERDKNARVMTQYKFDRLTENIKDNGGLFESLPLVTPFSNKGDNQEFLIISGHHRIRAARSAQMTEVHVIVIERNLTKDEIIAKQLSHNALSGEDDNHVLRELYNEIETIDFKISSGLSDQEVKIPQTSIKISDVQVELEYEVINILFLPRQVERMKEVFAKIAPEAQVYLADKADFERLAEQCREIHNRDNIINLAAIFSRMLDIVEQYHKDTPLPEPEK